MKPTLTIKIRTEIGLPLLLIVVEPLQQIKVFVLFTIFFWLLATYLCCPEYCITNLERSLHRQKTVASEPQSGAKRRKAALMRGNTYVFSKYNQNLDTFYSFMIAVKHYIISVILPLLDPTKTYKSTTIKMRWCLVVCNESPRKSTSTATLPNAD